MDGCTVAMGSSEGHKWTQILAPSQEPRVVTREGLKPEPQRWSKSKSSLLLSDSTGDGRGHRGWAFCRDWMLGFSDPRVVVRTPRDGAIAWHLGQADMDQFLGAQVRGWCRIAPTQDNLSWWRPPLLPPPQMPACPAAHLTLLLACSPDPALLLPPIPGFHFYP